jgi:hypothetical protein
MKYFRTSNTNILLGQIVLLKRELEEASQKAKIYQHRWKETRKHLKQANKGAERNAIALELATFKLNQLRKLTINKINEENSKEASKEECEN